MGNKCYIKQDFPSLKYHILNRIFMWQTTKLHGVPTLTMVRFPRKANGYDNHIGTH